MRRKPGVIRQVVLGLLLGLFLLPQLPGGQVQAQFAVYDGAAWSQRLGEYIKEANRWIETVNHYSTMVEKATQQVTTLGGILTTADKILSHNNNIVATMSNLGQSIRGIFALKRQIESLVHYKIQALKNMDDRLRGGIFNLEADKQDLEDYLQNSIGRASQDRVATLETVANMDTLLSRWQDDLMYARGKKAALVKEKEEAEKKLEEELAKDADHRCGSCITDLKVEIANCEAQIIQLDKQIADLMDKIQERLKTYQVEMVWRGDAAHDVNEMEKAWDGFFSVKEDLTSSIENYTYGNERRPQE